MDQTRRCLPDTLRALSIVQNRCEAYCVMCSLICIEMSLTQKRLSLWQVNECLKNVKVTTVKNGSSQSSGINFLCTTAIERVYRLATCTTYAWDIREKWMNKPLERRNMLATDWKYSAMPYTETTYCTPDLRKTTSTHISDHWCYW